MKITQNTITSIELEGDDDTYALYEELGCYDGECKVSGVIEIRSGGE